MWRPDRSEYDDYYHLYVGQVPDGEIIQTLDSQRYELLSLLQAVSEERGAYRYADGKWTLKEVLGHINDTERVMGYRSLAFARGDRTALPGFEQDKYVSGGNFANRFIEDLVDEFETMRTSHLVLFRTFDEQIWMRRGTASGCEFTTRAIAWILAGHVIHHMAVLRDRYL
jgi:hypothetical protein